MKKYKLIAIDIDGTLINDQKIILEETKKDILKVHEKDVIVCICTGRGYPAASPYVRELGINIPLILYNGSRVRMSIDNTLIYNQVIDNNVAKTVFETIEKHNGTCCFWANDALYFNKNDKYTVFYENLTKIKPNIITELTDELSCNVNKFIWFDTSANLVTIQKSILSTVSGINYFKSQSEILEIVPVGVSKGTTLKKLADNLGINQEEVIAIGDDENDISMIEYAGLGVAMGNAKEIVKDKANHITLTNNQNGVGEVIRKFIL